MDINYYPYFSEDNKILGFVVNGRNITYSKQTEMALKESEDKLRTVIESSPTITFVLDKTGVFELSEGKELKALGLKPGEVVGLSAFEVYKDYPDTINSIKGALSGETRESELNVDGVVFDVQYSPLKNEKGEIEKVIGVASNITERKKTQEELQKIQKLESLGVLAGGIAHDFNNLLGGIFGYIDLAHDIAKDDEVLGFLIKTLNTIDRARNLTRQLLTFSKGGAPVRKIGKLSPLVKETALFALSGSSVSCDFEISQELWSSNFDSNQIAQVIDNLMINAQQAMPGGGTIELVAANISIKEGEHPTLSAGDYVQISIKDCGIGIPGEALTSIFDPFYTTKDKGHGLGLSTCYSIVKRHDGCIDVESEPGKGTTFHLYLPASEESVLSGEKKSAVKHKGSGTVLIMDDEEVMREVIGDILESLGYSAVYKTNGKDTIDFLSAEIKADRKITAMVLDLTIPGGMGGKEAITEIRKLDAKLPVFVASGYAEDPVMAHPSDHGFTASISKPFRKAELVELFYEYMK